jgi:hypothetical protein
LRSFWPQLDFTSIRPAPARCRSYSVASSVTSIESGRFGAWFHVVSVLTLALCKSLLGVSLDHSYITRIDCMRIMAIPVQQLLPSWPPSDGAWAIAAYSRARLIHSILACWVHRAFNISCGCSVVYSFCCATPGNQASAPAHLPSPSEPIYAPH